MVFITGKKLFPFPWSFQEFIFLHLFICAMGFRFEEEELISGGKSASKQNSGVHGKARHLFIFIFLIYIFPTNL